MTEATTVAIIIQTGNAAFADHPATEVARMLHEVANSFIRDNALEPRKLHDINGNVCGEVKVTIASDAAVSRSRAGYEHKSN
jgi:hypothetical protein